MLAKAFTQSEQQGVTGQASLILQVLQRIIDEAKATMSSKMLAKISGSITAVILFVKTGAVLYLCLADIGVEYSVREKETIPALL